jgi:hypothetical protein
MIDLTDLRLGDIIETRKPHPCGGTQWTVVRLGADIGLRCCTCNRKVVIARQRLARTARAHIRPENPDDASHRPLDATDSDA